MAPLFKKWFKATGDIHRIADQLLTPSFGQPVVQTLARLEWDGNFADALGETAHNLHQAEDSHEAAGEGHGERGRPGARALHRLARLPSARSSSR